MSAQATDTVLLEGTEFSLVAALGTGLFEPNQHGLEPVMLSTSCYRGYYCTYAVVEGALRLREVRLGLDSSQSPEATLFGRSLEPLMRHTIEWGDSGDCKRVLVKSEFGHQLLGLDELVPFTGGLLLARDFIHSMSDNMGTQPVFYYGTVHEVLFQDGRALRSVDCSPQVEKFRQMPRWDLEQLAACFELPYDLCL